MKAIMTLSIAVLMAVATLFGRFQIVQLIIAAVAYFGV